jgi:uncharacterized protein (DUF58 family)
MKARLPLRQGFLARLAGVRELGRRFLLAGSLPEAIGAPPEEFEGHHPYLPGEDVRWIDWNLAARQDELFVKVFRTDEEVETILLVDASGSMTGGAGEKYAAAAAAAAALAWLALLCGAPVRLCRYADRLLDTAGPWRHPSALAAVQTRLAEPAPAATGTDLARALDPILAVRGRPIALAALTDGFQQRPLEAAAARALAAGVRHLSVVRVIDPRDLSPRLRGNLLLVDQEGGGERRLVADRALEEAAHRRIAAHFRALAERFAALGAPLHELQARRPFEEAFLAMLAGAAPPMAATSFPARA